MSYNREYRPTNPSETFRFSNPLYRQDIWHEDWYHNFEIIEDELIATDVRSNRDQYHPSEERIFLASDTGEIFVGTGTGWDPVLAPLAGDNINYENGQFHAPVVNEDGQLVGIPDHDHSGAGEGSGPLGQASRVPGTSQFEGIDAQSGSIANEPVNDTDIARLLETTANADAIDALEAETAPLDGGGTAEIANYAAVGADAVQTDRLQEGSNPAETISGAGSTLSFVGSEGRDIHNSTDVTLSNASGASVTEDVTVDYYEGADNTGTLMASETQSVSLADAGSTTNIFLRDDFGIGAGDYYIEVTTTDLTVDSIDEHTLGAEFVTEQTDEGDLVTTDQNGRERVRYDAASDRVIFPTLSAGSATIGADDDPVATEGDLETHRASATHDTDQPADPTSLDGEALSPQSVDTGDVQTTQATVDDRLVLPNRDASKLTIGGTEFGPSIYGGNNRTREGPLEIIGNEDNIGILLRADHDEDPPAPGEYAKISWYSGDTYIDSDGNEEHREICTISPHGGHNHWSFYQRTTPITHEDGNIVKSMQIQPIDRFEYTGSGEFEFQMKNNDHTNIEGSNPDLQIQASDRDAADPRIKFQYDNGNTFYQIRSRMDLGGQLEFRNPDFNRTMSMSPNGRVQFHGNETTGVVWESDSTRPSSPSTGQRFFDTSLGQPIWYDGTDWVDAQGTVV